MFIYVLFVYVQNGNLTSIEELKRLQSDQNDEPPKGF